jgi:hypothetical protein
MVQCRAILSRSRLTQAALLFRLDFDLFFVYTDVIDQEVQTLGASVTVPDEQGMHSLIAAPYQNNLSVTDLLIPP